jgi:ABC-2 type transport system permease protein
MSEDAGFNSGKQDDKLFYYIWKLIRLRWILFLSNLKRSKTRQKIGYGVLVIVIFGLMAGAFALSWVILNFLNSPSLTQYLGDPAPFLSAVPTMVFFAAFAGVLIASFGVMLQALYLANDMDFLLSAPVPIRAVFVSKLLQAVLPNFGLVSLFGLPILFGLGASQHYNLLFFPLVILILILLALSAAGIASLLVMGIVRIFPARRVAEVLAFIGAILSFICGQSGQLFRFRSEPTQTANALNSLSKINAPWFPFAWAGRGLVAIGQGYWLIGSVELILISSFVGVIFWVSLGTAERLYYSGWATAQIVLVKKKTQHKVSTLSDTKSQITVWIAPILPAPVRAIIVKDFHVLRRDLRNLSQLVTPLIFGVLYAFILLRDTHNPSPNGSMGSLNTLATYGNTGIALFVGWMLLMRLALIAFSQEGKSYWLIKSSPVPDWGGSSL